MLFLPLRTLFTLETALTMPSFRSPQRAVSWPPHLTQDPACCFMPYLTLFQPHLHLTYGLPISPLPLSLRYPQCLGWSWTQNSYMSSEGMALMTSSNSQSKILCIPAPTAPVQGQPTLGPAPVVCKLRRQHLPPHGANAPTNPVILTLR